MKAQYVIYLMMFLMTCFSSQGFGQIQISSTDPDLSIYLNAEENQQVRQQQLQQGLQYRYFYPNIKGHQYFEKALYMIGSISFEGVYYDNVLLNYDVFNDLVLTPVVRNGLTENIILDNARIDWFQLGDLPIFVNSHSDTSTLSEGIYQLLSKKQEVALYLRTKKEVSANVGRPGELLEKFVKKASYLLVVNNSVHVIKKRKDLEKALEHRPQAIEYIKTSKLRFKNDRDLSNSLVQVVNQL